MVELNYFKQLVGCVFLSVTLALLAGCQTQGTGGGFQSVQLGPPHAGGLEAATNANPAASNPSGSIFHVGDMVVVNFSGLSTEALPQPHEERVKEDGTITLPLIQSVKAEGKSPGELQKLIRDKYVSGKFYPESLNVTVKGQERLFFVDGEVRTPGRYPWTEGMTVLKAISSAGGFTDFADKSEVTVTRQDGRTLKVNCKKAMDNPELDLPVYPGERVYVPRRWI